MKKRNGIKITALIMCMALSISAFSFAAEANATSSETVLDISDSSIADATTRTDDTSDSTQTQEESETESAVPETESGEETSTPQETSSEETVLTTEGTSEAESSITEEDDNLKVYSSGTPTVEYRTHVQTFGWQDYVQNGTTSGTVGLTKRLEGINIQVGETGVSGGVEYRTHVQTYGWMDWVSDGSLSGTVGEAKRLEAIQIRLTGEMAEKYDIYYRVHSQTYGWLDWACNGEGAGTVGLTKRLEAIQIVLVQKGEAAPGGTAAPYIENLKVTYQTHVQSYGWINEVSDGSSSGTVGEAKRLESLKVRLEGHSLIPGSIQYRVHCQTYGWMDWVSEGQLAGTTGQAKRLEAIEILLTGEMAEKYDVYYRVHIQTFGWTGWAKNGDPAGSEAYAKRMEAIQVMLVEKGGAAPGSTDNTFYKPEFWGIDVSSYQGSINWAKAKADGVEFAMLRITKKNTTGTSATLMEDPYFKRNAQGALANGIQIGGYVYIYASTPEEAKAEAEYAVSLLKGYNITYPIAFDLEEDEHMTAAAKLNNMAMANAFCQVMQSAGYKTSVYGSPSKLRTAFDYDAVSSAYDVWLARYRWGDEVMDFSDSATRSLVYNTGYEGGNWTGLKNVQIWQFSSTGRVAGIAGNVDLDLCYKVY